MTTFASETNKDAVPARLLTLKGHVRGASARCRPGVELERCVFGYRRRPTRLLASLSSACPCTCEMRS
jgi:hypothetical protein